MAILSLLAAGRASTRPDYYTAGFYTRGSDAAFYMDQGGVIDPFYVPITNWSILPRVTLVYSQDDDFFMVRDAPQRSSLSLIPGALVIYGRPEHNHLYTDVSVALPLMETGASSASGLRRVVTLGGVKKTGKSQIYGRIGHRYLETEDVASGSRVANKDIVGSIGLENRISTKTSVGLNGSFELNRFGNAGYIDYNRYYGAGRFYYRITDKSELFLQGGIGRDELKEEQPGVYGSATFYDVSIGMRGKPRPKTTVSGRVGYRRRQYDDETISDIASWVANLGIETTPFGFSIFSAELLADIRPDITAAGDSAVDKRMTFGVNRRLFTERLKGDASVLFGTVDFRGPGGTSSEEYWGFTLGIDWWTRHNLSFGAAYSYIERWNASGGGPSYESGLWSLRMSWNY